MGQPDWLGGFVAPIVGKRSETVAILCLFPMIPIFFALVWKLLLPALLLVALVDLATMSTDRRVRLLRRAGLSQAAIASRLGVSRYAVRLALA
jgi:hypothetical protein